MGAVTAKASSGSGLTPDERVSFERQGYLIRPAVFAPHEVARLVEGFETLEAQAAGLRESTDVGEARFVMAPTGVAGAPRLQRVVWCGAAAPILWGPSTDRRVLEPALELLGAEQAEQLVHQAHFKHPGDGVRFALHQDAWNRRYGTALWRAAPGEAGYVQCLVTIDPMGSDNGPLVVSPGSHRKGPLLGLHRRRELEARVRDLPFVDVEAPAGSVVFFGPFLVHGSEPNQGNRPRRALVNGFARVGVNRRTYPGSGLGVRRSLQARQS